MSDIELLKQVDFENDDAIIDAVYDIKEANMYSGKDADGNDILVSAQPKVGIRVSTYQSNGWIRINDYEVTSDRDTGELIVIRSESYEK